MDGEGLAAAAATGTWCRKCGEPARVEGDPELGRAVHAGTGRELGEPDRHLCAPVGFQTAAMRAGRELRGAPR